MKPRRNSTREFQVEAVRRIAAEGKSPAEVSRELDLGESSLRSGKPALAADGDPTFPGTGHLSAVEDELRRLRAENPKRRRERAMFNNATAFFARESS